MSAARSLALVLVLGLCATPSRADLIVQTAAVDNTKTSDNGPFIYAGQWVGARFHLDETVHLDSLGARIIQTGIAGNNQLFLAVTDLGGSSLPTASPQTFTPLAVGLLNVGATAGVVTTNVDVTLAPGDYALILGSGRFGASGQGYLIDNETILTATVFQMESGNWVNKPDFTRGIHLVANGTVIPTPVPEPTTAVLVPAAAALGLLIRRRARS